MWKPPRYTKVPKEQPSKDESCPRLTSVDDFEEVKSSSRLFSYRTGFFLLLGFLVIILGGEVVRSQLPHRNPKQEAQSSLLESPCGNTTAEARARGCEFDLLSYSWLPQQCLDRETSAEFRSWILSPDRERGSWPFFTDSTFTSRISDEEALSERNLPVMTYTTWEEHLGHCVFLARRIYRSMGGDFGMDPHFGNYGHTVHCTAEVLKGIKEDQSESPHLSYFGVYFGTC